eukprot:1724245-Pyramimonas_sp.AAC.1
MGTTEDKRLSIDLGRLGQGIWTNGVDEVEILHPRILYDKIRWSDANIMAVGCLTEKMLTHFLVKVLRTSSYDVTSDLESILKNVSKQLARARVNAIPSG